MDYKIKKHRVIKFIEFGILPEDLSNLTEQQQEILEYISTSKKPFDTLLVEHINHADTLGKQKYILRKIKQRKGSMRDHVNFDPNLKPEDIIVNEYCPFFNTKLDYRSGNSRGITKNHYSIDRIDNSKMYTKGNIWVISRLANTMKNDATLSELKTFSINVIKQILINKNITV